MLAGGEEEAQGRDAGGAGAKAPGEGEGEGQGQRGCPGGLVVRSPQRRSSPQGQGRATAPQTASPERQVRLPPARCLCTLLSPLPSLPSLLSLSSTPSQSPSPILAQQRWPQGALLQEDRRRRGGCPLTQGPRPRREGRPCQGPACSPCRRCAQAPGLPACGLRRRQHGSCGQVPDGPEGSAWGRRAVRHVPLPQVRSLAPPSASCPPPTCTHSSAPSGPLLIPFPLLSGPQRLGHGLGGKAAEDHPGVGEVEAAAAHADSPARRQPRLHLRLAPLHLRSRGAGSPPSHAALTLRHTALAASDLPSPPRSQDIFSYGEYFANPSDPRLRKKRNPRKRTSSGDWGRDQLTEVDIAAYREAMGFAAA